MNRWLAGLCLAAALCPAHAEERPLWELGAGVGLLQLPHYRGSDQSHTWLLPVPYVSYRGEILKADREGARAVLYESSRVDFDLSLGASAPTRSDDNVARRGMADLPPTFELGPNINFTLARDVDWKLDLRAPVRTAITLQSHPRSIGWLSTPNLNLDLIDVGGWHVGLQAALVFGDRRYHAHFYDVAPQDVLPDRPAYQSRGGFGGGHLLASTSRRIGQFWVGAFGRLDSVRGAVFDDSPLVRQRNQWSLGMVVSWVFAASTKTVTSAE